jgi:hypothetical protein
MSIDLETWYSAEAPYEIMQYCLGARSFRILRGCASIPTTDEP